MDGNDEEDEEEEEESVTLATATGPIYRTVAQYPSVSLTREPIL